MSPRKPLNNRREVLDSCDAAGFVQPSDLFIGGGVGRSRRRGARSLSRGGEAGGDMGAR